MLYGWSSDCFPLKWSFPFASLNLRVRSYPLHLKVILLFTFLWNVFHFLGLLFLVNHNVSLWDLNFLMFPWILFFFFRIVFGFLDFFLFLRLSFFFLLFLFYLFFWLCLMSSFLFVFFLVSFISFIFFLFRGFVILILFWKIVLLFLWFCLCFGNPLVS